MRYLPSNDEIRKLIFYGVNAMLKEGYGVSFLTESMIFISHRLSFSASKISDINLSQRVFEVKLMC